MVRPADYIHPEDEAARRNMEAIPGFAAAMKLFMRYYDEQIVHGMNIISRSYHNLTYYFILII